MFLKLGREIIQLSRKVWAPLQKMWFWGFYQKVLCLTKFLIVEIKQVSFCLHFAYKEFGYELWVIKYIDKYDILHVKKFVHPYLHVEFSAVSLKCWTTANIWLKIITATGLTSIFTKIGMFLLTRKVYTKRLKIALFWKNVKTLTFWPMSRFNWSAWKYQKINQNERIVFKL